MSFLRLRVGNCERFANGYREVRAAGHRSVDGFSSIYCTHSGSSAYFMCCDMYDLSYNILTADVTSTRQTPPGMCLRENRVIFWSSPTFSFDSVVVSPGAIISLCLALSGHTAKREGLPFPHGPQRRCLAPISPDFGAAVHLSPAFSLFRMGLSTFSLRFAPSRQI